MREYSEYVNNRWKEWNERFKIPFEYEFQLKTMFELEEQFRDIPPEHVKTKQDILNMIQDIFSKIGNVLKRKKIRLNSSDYIFCYIDFNYDDNTTMIRNECTVNIFNLHTGKHIMYKINNKTYKEISCEIIKLVLANKPSKIIFNKIGNGLALYDSFKKIAKLVQYNISIDSEGNVTY